MCRQSREPAHSFSHLHCDVWRETKRCDAGGNRLVNPSWFPNLAKILLHQSSMASWRQVVSVRRHRGNWQKLCACPFVLTCFFESGQRHSACSRTSFVAAVRPRKKLIFSADRQNWEHWVQLDKQCLYDQCRVFLQHPKSTKHRFTSNFVSRSRTRIASLSALVCLPVVGLRCPRQWAVVRNLTSRNWQNHIWPWGDRHG